MKRTGRILALAGAPVLLAGLLLSGSAGFSRAGAGIAGGKSVSTLNRLSDKIEFTGNFRIVGGSQFVINSSSCTLRDEGKGPAIPCILASVGALDLMSSSATGDVTITGRDGTIAFHQTAVHGCATGTGIEVPPAPGSPEPVRVEGVSTTTPVSPTMLTVSGTIFVYEAGAGRVGIDCVPG